MERKDLRLEPGEEKKKVYEQIHSLFLQGKSVEMAEHKSGLPAVTVDCEDIHIITDILALEIWGAKNKK